MTLVLSHTSAIDFLRANSASIPLSCISDTYCEISKQQARKILADKTNSNEVSLILERYESILAKPVHVLVLNTKSRFRSKHLECHIAPKELPRKPLINIPSIYHSTSIYVCNVPLLLAQVAPSLSRGQLGALCLELSGTYRLHANDECEYHVQPLASIREIQQFATQNPNIRGCKRLQQTSRYLAGQAASPMEAALAILLGFPTIWGGYGLPVPTLNHTIDIPPQFHTLAGKQHYIGDLVWPAHKLIVEYDSDTYHVGRARIASDALRRNLLMRLGYSAITVTSNQIYNHAKLDALAEQISRQLKHRLRITHKSHGSAVYALRSDLLKANLLNMANESSYDSKIATGAPREPLFSMDEQGFYN